MATERIIPVNQTSPDAPIRSVLRVQGAALKMMEEVEGKKAANDVVRGALQAGGDFWINVFLPMRFTDYAKRLGYYVTDKWNKLKDKITSQVIPLVYIGESRDAALGGAYATATAKGDGGRITIRVPTKHPLKAKEQAVIRRVPEWEIKRIAKEIEENLIESLNGRGLHLMTKPPILAPPAKVAHRDHDHAHVFTAGATKRTSS
jgi:hypothetical protein